jgi:BMFP domain-containing protein YqiC
MEKPESGSNNPADALRELSRKITSLLPSSVQQAQQDIESSVHTLLQTSLSRMNLVTREEFDVQAALLARTREKLDRLEKLLEQLEENSGDR